MRSSATRARACLKIAPGAAAEMKRLMRDEAEIDRILGEGAGRARAIAAPILRRTYDIMGMVGAPAR